ncbi:electron transport complex subunit RsxC [Clostridiaceae bacterium HSG29]|nr:electron transport complex subunit RsxC [Clostridiaceae bacterium HSG29]
MGLLTFKGGIHPPHGKKYSEKKAIEKADNPKIVKIPLSQHIGAPCKPIVEKGDVVKVGQKIGEPLAFVSAPVHSSVSGVVKAVKTEKIAGGMGNCVVIESDGKFELSEEVSPKGTIETLSGKEILAIIKDAGIVGMGGAGFPTHVKLSPPPDKNIDLLILNGAECEPYLTADHRLMLERADDIVYGLKALMKVLDVEKGYIGIENNKPDAIKVMTEAAKDENIIIQPLKTKYPQGAEKQLINAISGREVPSGGLPMEAGAVVNNVATAYAIADAIKTGMPLIKRICTITGSAIKEPKNLEILVGTELTEIVNQCGGFKEEPGKILLGGPMMGRATSSIDVPSTKTTSGILAFNRTDAVIDEPSLCIKCGKCVEVCPINLLPVYISANAENGNFEKAEKLNAMDCIECGSCSFICPSKRRLLEGIRLTKNRIRSKKQK